MVGDSVTWKRAERGNEKEQSKIGVVVGWGFGYMETCGKRKEKEQSKIGGCCWLGIALHGKMEKEERERTV